MNVFAYGTIASEQQLALTAFFLVAKITVVLGVVWLLHFALRRANPRWRVLVWRGGAAGILLLGFLTACPPLLRLPMLPSASMHHDIEVPVTADVAPSKPTANATQVQAIADRPTAPPPEIAELRRPLYSHQETTNTVQFATDDTSDQPAPTHSRSWLQWLAIAYGAGLALGAARLAFGAWRLSTIKKLATTVPAPVEAEALLVAKKLGISRQFQLRQSSDIQSPCLISPLHPTVLLPPALCDAKHAAELPSVLSHELAHLRGGDLPWNDLFAVLAAVLWFHPLAWRIGRAHADTCDEVSDAIAADYLGDGQTYGRTLARLALRVQNPTAMAGLAMARPSGIRRRVEAIQRHVFRYALPRHQSALALAVFTIACVLLGGLAVTRSVAETPSEQSKDAKVTTQQMVIQAVDDKTGEPLPDVQFEFHGRIGGKGTRENRTTKADGTAEFAWEAGKRVTNLWLTAKKPAYTPIHYSWRNDRREIKLPAKLELRFQAGQLIGGVVRDESGNPISGASVELSMPITWPRRASHVFTLATMKTDAEGRWQFDGAPADASSVSVRAKHAGFMSAGMSAAPTMDNVLVLKRGLQIEGKVVDRDNKPIPGAKTALGFDRFGSSDPEAKCDEEGHFVLKNCKPGRSLITIQADGFSPQAKEIVVGDKNEAMTFVLDPGHTMRASVVDVDGKPVKGAFFAADTWRNYRSLKFRVDTPADGRVVWNSAPADTVLCDIGKTGYMSARRVACKPDGEEIVVTLYPVLEVSGSVTDKRSGKPIQNFRVTHGYQFQNSSQTYWNRDEAIDGQDGKYTYKFDEPMKGYFLRVVAPGYLPATSRLLECTEGKATIDFSLEPGEGPSGIVLLPDGQPAEGVQVGLATPEKRAFFDMGRFDSRQNQADVVDTDAAGRFSFVPQASEEFVLIALHDAGFAQVTSTELKTSSELRLQPWGRIEGKVLLGNKPDIGREVSFYPSSRSQDRHYVFSYGYDTKADESGKFAIERVMPGAGSLSRVVITEFLRSWQHAPGWQQSIDVRPNETTTATIGGTGRPVTGQLVLDRTPDTPIDWTTNEPASLTRARDAETNQELPYVRYLGSFDKTGRFTIPDVPAGNYVLSADVNNPPVPNACGAGEAIGKAEFAFTVPEMPDGRSDEPLDLGQIDATLFDTLDAGNLRRTLWPSDWTAARCACPICAASWCSSTSGRPGADRASPRCPT